MHGETAEKSTETAEKSTRNVAEKRLNSKSHKRQTNAEALGTRYPKLLNLRLFDQAL
jgi:hypothetical protein